MIDKPVRVATPLARVVRPDRGGTSGRGGFRISTGARRSAGIVQRLDVGTSGVMVIAKSEQAYSVLKNAFRHRTVDKTTTHSCRQPGSADWYDRCADRAQPQVRPQVRPCMSGRTPPITHYETLEAHQPRCWRST